MARCAKWGPSAARVARRTAFQRLSAALLVLSLGNPSGHSSIASENNQLSPSSHSSSDVYEPAGDDALPERGQRDGPLRLGLCRISSRDCVSTENDDKYHFVEPWIWSASSRKDAMQRLVDVATGASSELEIVQGERDRKEVAVWVLESTLQVVGGNENLPAAPGPKNVIQANPFRGKVLERDDELGYLRLRVTLGGEVEESTASDPSSPSSSLSPTALTETYDIEFSFVPEDEIVEVRAAGRSGRDVGDGSIAGFLADPTEALSRLSDGAFVEANGGRALLEVLRKELRWQIAPVIAEWDTGFNNDQKIWFERVFETFGAPIISNNNNKQGIYR